MLHGIVKIPVTDLRAGPEMTSERLNQALFGTPVEIRKVQNKYIRVALPDGYCGWCPIGHIEQIAFARWQKYVKHPKHRVKTEFVRVRGPVFGGSDPFRLYFGTELIVGQTEGITRFETPGGERVHIRASTLSPPIGKRRQEVEIKDIIAGARLFLGTPYLWGGITSAGIDCSGLVQMAFRFHGLDLPRDSRHQRKTGFAVGREELRPGDLLFFPGHVAISLGGNRFIHASASRGMTVIDSFDSTAPNYRRDLDEGFEFARRIQL